MNKLRVKDTPDGCEDLYAFPSINNLTIDQLMKLPNSQSQSLYVTVTFLSPTGNKYKAEHHSGEYSDCGGNHADIELSANGRDVRDFEATKAIIQKVTGGHALGTRISENELAASIAFYHFHETPSKIARWVKEYTASGLLEVKIADSRFWELSESELAVAGISIENVKCGDVLKRYKNNSNLSLK